VTNLDISLGTDVAHFLIFHPDDLAHHAGTAIGWYAEPDLFRAESAAGRLVAFSTGGDGGFRLRLTTDKLTDVEASAVRCRSDFPLRVSHGIVFVDNGDGLPGADQVRDPQESADQWFEVPNGDYRVVVAGLDRRPGLDVPDYVVTFVAVTDLAAIPIQGPPDLSGTTPYFAARDRR